MEVLRTTELHDFARRHHGLVTRRAWTDAGGSSRTFHRWAADGRLTYLAPNVAALPGRTIGTIQRIAAGVLAFAPAAASHRSAAWSWGGGVDGAAPVDLLPLGRPRTTEVEGFVLHRPSDGGVHVVRRRGLPCTTPTRTLLDLAGVAPDAVGPALERLLVTGLVTAPSMVAALERHRRRGRPGIAAVVAAMDDLDLAVPESVLEARMARVFTRAGLEGWEAHAPVAGYTVDFCFRPQRTIVEVDGWRWHGALRRRWERDVERDFDLRAAGWDVLHVTWRLVARRPGAVVAYLRSALADRTPPVRGALAAPPATTAQTQRHMWR